MTVCSADGLGAWYETQFEAFTEQTGITVNYVEGGSGEVLSRAEKERSNPQMDVLITLPPFIQRADEQQLLAPTTDADGTADTNYVALANNYFAMIRGTGVDPQPQTWDDLLDPRFAQKLQYSTPGQAGDGTAMLLLLQHVLGAQQGLDYLGKLQANNVGPSASTGKLGPKVAKGELSVANSDVQMALAAISADQAAYEVFVPAGPDGTRTTVALPYFMGQAASAPHAANAAKLIDFLLSVPVQETLAEQVYGMSPRADVTAVGPQAEAIAKALAGVTVWQPDWSVVNADFDALISAYNKATGQ
ncbi:2-aminoethylphosphonate ABC transporter substrate-binding protein [Gordonia phosphorivorans]|uniref:2-aminoethylphosphonate ABC transporter substrate-binding protein n=1 Tax=Gordonia phosphorivorans TaxID=1056982 RepID=A0ABV6H986_9ACTN